MHNDIDRFIQIYTNYQVINSLRSLCYGQRSIDELKQLLIYDSPILVNVDLGRHDAEWVYKSLADQVKFVDY